MGDSNGNLQFIQYVLKMKSTIIVFAVIEIILSFAMSDVANSQDTPLLEDAYIGSEPGARPIGMGGAFSSLSGPSSIFWNPAGLNILPKNVISVSFKNKEGIVDKILFLVFASNQAALSWHLLSNVKEDDLYSKHIVQKDTVEIWSDIEYRIDEYILTVTSLTGKDEPAKSDFFIGINLKYLTGRFGIAKKLKKNGEWIEPEVNLDSGNGFGVDAGILYDKKRVDLGIAVQNILAMMYWHDYKKDRPEPNLRAGFAMKLFEKLILAFDVAKKWNKKDPFIYRLGAETVLKEVKNDTTNRSWYKKFVSCKPSFRLGAYTSRLRDEDIVYTGGFGFIYPNHTMDIAFSKKYGRKKPSIMLTTTIAF